MKPVAKVPATYQEQDTNQAGPVEKTVSDVNGPYARYVLLILMLVYVVNHMDRSIFTVLAEAIKADLVLKDAQIGFLGGTAFAVTYALFGVPLGRLADTSRRTGLISLAISFWSLMTVLSGTARGFLSLAACRLGVGMGESGTVPAAHSLLYDYFSDKVRTLAIAVFSCGAIIGGGLGLFLGGTLLTVWNETWPDPSLAPLGLKGWQATFMIVGGPGLILAFIISLLKEPVRGQADGLVSTHDDRSASFGSVKQEFFSMMPLLNLWALRQAGASRVSLYVNICAAIVLAGAATLLIKVTDDSVQWSVLAIGCYGIFSWSQSLKCRDQVCFGMVFSCRTLKLLYAGYAFCSFSATGIAFWMIPYYQRLYGLTAQEIGGVIGLGLGVSGLLGLLIGGLLGDKLRKSHQTGKLYLIVGGYTVSFVLTLGLLLTKNLYLSYACLFANTLVGTITIAPMMSTVNDLVIPRSRAVVTAITAVISIFSGGALGPYIAGALSDGFISPFVSEGEALRQALLILLMAKLVGVLIFVTVFKHLSADENSLKERARALGEDI